ncbi:replication protein A 14 kDa subunit-like [Ornithodoros turicata]|uniref:Putative secreted protein n=1 Tax=Ornithodoros turicata TaxID=34597 RepID=A0A2R5LFR5_9ACAR
MRVNGNLLPRYQRKTVFLLGRVLQSDPKGMSFKIESSDNQVIQVILKSPLQEPVEGFVEVEGEVTAKNAILCSDYVLLSPSVTEKFDMATYNKVIEVIHAHPSHYPVQSI